MKKQSFILFTSLSNTDIQNLTREVKETIAFGLVAPIHRNTNHKAFTAAELWNIQRQGKSRPQRRFL